MKSRHLALLTPFIILSILFSVISDASNLGGTGGGGGSGSMSMGALDGTTAAATGAVISGSSLYMQSASATVPGLVNTTSQVFAGIKRFQDNLYVGSAPSAAWPFSVDATMVSSSNSYQIGNVIGRRTVSASDTDTTLGHAGLSYVTVSAGQSAHGQTSGLYGETRALGAGTIDFATGVRSLVSNQGTGGVTDAANFFSGTMTNTGGGSLTNTYGLFIRDNTVGTTNYPIYSQGTKESYFTGGGSLSAGKFFVSNEGNLSKVNNVYYNWPASQGSATTYLKNDGSGNLSWASVASGSGDVVGPSSSVDGEVATMNGTTGKLIRSEPKLTINATTGAMTNTFAGGPSQLMTEDLSTATTWTSARVVSGTIASASSSIYPEDFTFTHTLSGSKQITGRYYRPTLSGSTSARAVGELQDLTATVSGNSWGGHQVSVSGVFGHNIRTYNASSSGASGAYVGTTQANYSLALSGVGIASIGSNGKSGGVSGAGSTSNSPTIAYGGYFRLDANYDTGTETEVWPSVSAALIANTGDVATTIPAFVAMNNGGSVFQVRGTGDTVIGAHGGTATHVVNGNLKINGQAASLQFTATQAASSAHTIDWNNSNSVEWDLQAATGNITLTLSNPLKGASYVIKIIQSSTARTVTWPSNVKWPGGTAPTLTTTNDAVDVITLYYDGVNYLGSFGLDVK